MKTRTVILTAVGLIVGATAFAAGEPPPAWTYPWAPAVKL